MAFCIICGQELAEGANFCANCGKAVSDNKSTAQRKTVYDGEIHKCPNCGDVVSSFSIECPSCGYEIRGVSSSETIRMFISKLESARTYQEKVQTIKTFPIPNTKEDILEFAILAVTNINSGVEKNKDEVKMNDAWITKVEQIREKARIMGYEEIGVLFDSCFSRIQKSEEEKRNKFLLVVALILMIAALCILRSMW